MGNRLEIVALVAELREQERWHAIAADAATPAEIADWPDGDPYRLAEHRYRRAADALEQTLAVLTWVVEQHANQDMSHEDFRVEAFSKASAALTGNEA